MPLGQKCLPPSLLLFLFIYLFLAVLGLRFVRGLSPVAASGGHSSSRCAGLSLSRPLPLQSTGSRHAGSVVVAHGPSCSAACGIFPDQDSNPRPLHWQADSQPLRHQGSPILAALINSLPPSTWYLLPETFPCLISAPVVLQHTVQARLLDLGSF